MPIDTSWSKGIRLVRVQYNGCRIAQALLANAQMFEYELSLALKQIDTTIGTLKMRGRSSLP